MPYVQVLTNNLNAKWGYTASRDDNNIGSLADLYSSWFSCALDFDHFASLENFKNLSPRVDLEIFTLAWTSTKFSKDATQASINEESTQVYFLSLIFSKSCTVFFVSDFDSALSKTDDLPPCKFSYLRGLQQSISTSGLRNFHTCVDFDNLSPRMDLEIFTLAWTLKIYFHEWT
ncbi:hypothetical protein V1477_009491 [Vespula maculifrons]|uniref:Uncharacterized protein n=1 Tax=Vespula maculifrons TaxID=7453 RepID=A0ABD2C9X3_VESMC